jgi:hypothetical protein
MIKELNADACRLTCHCEISIEDLPLIPFSKFLRIIKNQGITIEGDD